MADSIVNGLSSISLPVVGTDLIPIARGASTLTKVTVSELLSVRQQTRTLAQAVAAISWLLGDTIIIGALTADSILATPTDAVAGNTYRVICPQDGTADRVLTLFDGSTITSSMPNEKMYAVFYYDGTDYLRTF